jgi:DNA uptake protein ComE-like DNA-binding protein
MTRTAQLWQKSRRPSIWTNGLAALAITIGLAWIAGCNANGTPQSDQQLKQEAAKTTEQAKQEAQQAAADAKVAAANAERKVDDIAAGVKQGFDANGKPLPGSIDINSASTDQLETLPGISATRARRIVDNRPYTSPHDLVSKGVVSEAEYARVSGKIVAN